MAGIDREALVRRHNVVLSEIDPRSPLQVGNGELSMAVDVTGLQTFPDQYPVPDPAGGPTGTLLGTQTQWGWHSVPPPGGVEPSLPYRSYRSGARLVPYVDAPAQEGSDDSNLDRSSRWLRANPHRLDLARIGLVTVDEDGAVRLPTPADLGRTRQELDLWHGLVRSELELSGTPFSVRTACHPERDALAVRVTSEGRAGVRLAFPYGSESWSVAADWTRADNHRTVVDAAADGAVVDRIFDDASAPTYRLQIWTRHLVEQTGRHELVVGCDAAPGTEISLVVELTPGATPPGVPLTTAEVEHAAAEHWPRFWRSGAALDLSGTSDPRAEELERRTVLSQYLTAIQCAGSLPPQETGLLGNSWRGRVHLEMHWWHAAHFALWGRPELLARSMGFYRRILPLARETATRQGYAGARWPKQVGPDGRESPSHIGPFLLWQQPHVIFLAELLRRAGHPLPAWYGELVDATARFMADVVVPTDRGYDLGPPLVPAQESYAHLRAEATNPPFELAYWAWALRVAQQWRVRDGHAPEPRWDAVADGMSPPLVREGSYAAIAVEPYTIRTDHPSMVYGLGVVPDVGLLDPDVVRATLSDIIGDWDWPSTWGWDYPALAMTATRLGDPSTAVDLLLRPEEKNTFLANGHNRQTAELPAYLPGNGGLLAAVALMAGGWDGAAADAPGFPDTWVVRHEGFVSAP